MGVRVRVEQAVDVAQQHQQVRFAQFRHDGGQRVVVAQHLVGAGLDLGGGHGVVFVDDGDNPHLQQRRERGAQVRRSLLVCHVAVRQQDLRRIAVVFREQFVVDVHHAALADRGRSLFEAQLLRPFRQSQLGRAHGDGAGTDQDHLVAFALQIRHGAHQALHAAQIQVSVLMRQRGRADFYDDPLFPLFFHKISPSCRITGCSFRS